MSAMGADSGIKQGEVVEWADPRAELDDIKAEGLRGQQTVDGALARLSAFTASEAKWGASGLGYATVAEFLRAECPWLAQLAIPVSPRREIVALMSAQETPQKAIAAALGVSPQTVSLDIKITNLGVPPVTSKNVTNRDAGPKSGAQRERERRERKKQQQEPVSADHTPNGSKTAEDSEPETEENTASMASSPSSPVQGSVKTGTTGTAAAASTSAEPGPEPEPQPDPQPDPQPCPRCAPQVAHLEQLIDDLGAQLEKAHAEAERLGRIRPDVVMAAELAAVAEDRDWLAVRVAELEARLSAAPVAAEQDDPGNDTDEPGSAADGGVCEGCGGPGAPAWSLQGSGARGEHVVCDRCLEKARQRFPGVVFSREELLGVSA